MRIGIDMRMVGTGEGIGRYIEELVRHLALIDDQNDYYLLVSKNFPPEAGPPLADKFIIVKVKSPYYSLLEQTYFIWELARLRLDLVHFPSFNAPVFYPGRFVVTIHDIIHHQYPGRKKSRVLHRLAYRLTIWAAVMRAKKIIAVSEATKKDIIKAFRVSPEKIQVIYEGAELKAAPSEDIAAVLSRYNITKPFLLFVGVWRQYKNLPNLARAFDVIRDQYRIDCQLVLAGKIDDFYPEIKAEVMSIKHAADIRPLGFIPEIDLAALYQNAKIFVLPSLVEGFGLIGVEAQAAGLPVAASDIAVLHEILGYGAVYFDPSDPAGMAEKIVEIWQDAAHFTKLRKLAQDNVARFDWRKTALETLTVYNKV